MHLKSANERQPRLQSIKAALKLNDTEYKDFSAHVETLLYAKGIVDLKLSSAAQRHNMQARIAKMLAESGSARLQFGETTDLISSEAGQRAFRLMIYKIRSNHRRRQQALRANEDPSQDMDSRSQHHGIPSHTGSSGRPGTTTLMTHDNDGPVPTDTDELRLNMMSIYRPGNQLKAVCRPSDVLHSGNDACDINNLSFRLFLNILQADHDFTPQLEYLTWESTNGMDNGSIDNERQWKAVIADQLAEGRSIMFVVARNGDGTEEGVPSRCREANSTRQILTRRRTRFRGLDSDMRGMHCMSSSF